jgi:hypothetical protein
MVLSLFQMIGNGFKLTSDTLTNGGEIIMKTTMSIHAVFTVILSGALLLVLPGGVQAVSYTNIQSGGWNTSSCWSNSPTPPPGVRDERRCL